MNTVFRVDYLVFYNMLSKNQIFKYILILLNYMTLDQVLKKTKIEFKSRLNLDQLDELFKYLARNLKVTITSTTEIYRQFAGLREESEDNTLGETTNIYVRGNIFGLEYDTDGEPEFLGPDIFKCEADLDDPVLRFKELRFEMIPGYDLHEYDKNHTKLWDKVREHVSKFFKEEYEFGKHANT